MKAATATTRRTPVPGARTSTTRSPTRTGTLAFGPPVTINSCAGELPRRFTQATSCNSVVSLAYLLRRTHLGVWITASRKYRKPHQHLLMGKKHKNLFDRITSQQNLYTAYEKAARGKRYSYGHLQFKENIGANLASLRQALSSGSYQPGLPNKFFVYEPKKREITAMPFVDRVAQHALCNVIEPIFDTTFLPQSHACRKGKGTHSAAVGVQALLRQMAAKGESLWVLKTDFARYFYSIRHDVLHKEIRRKISCWKTLELIKKMIPPSGVGLPIGNLTSQLAANIYGHIVDRWLVHVVGITRFCRYMDDIVIIGHSREALDVLRMGLEWFAESRMGLRFSKWSIQPAIRGINFVGYRIWSGYKLLRKDSVLRAKRKIKRYTKHGETSRLGAFLASWRGHAKWADSHNLLTKLGAT